MRKYFVAIALLMGLYSCSTDSKDDYEMAILNEIFDDLLEEMGISSEFGGPPFPSMSVFDNNNNSIGYDTIVNVKIIDDNEKMRDSIFVLAVLDTLFSCLDKNLDVKSIENEFTDRGYVEALNAMKSLAIPSRLLNLSQIGNRENFTLKYYSEFPSGYKIWERENYDFHFLGVLEISRIYFDNKKQFGLLYSSYSCGRLCGEGAIICIRKIGNKWIVEKKMLLWVS